MLRGLAIGEVPPRTRRWANCRNWRTVAFLRELLMSCGALPAVDKHLLIFERWLDERLSHAEHHDHVRLLQQFATWHVLRRLRSRAERGHLGPAPTNEARQRVNQAAAFLAWLGGRGRALADCTQADVDAWHADAVRHPAPGSDVPALVHAHRPDAEARPAGQVHLQPVPHTQERRLDLIRQWLTDPNWPLRERVAGLLLLLYAQPVSRIVPPHRRQSATSTITSTFASMTHPSRCPEE
jgi:hypothetical protein